MSPPVGEHRARRNGNDPTVELVPERREIEELIPSDADHRPPRILEVALPGEEVKAFLLALSRLPEAAELLKNTVKNEATE